MDKKLRSVRLSTGIPYCVLPHILVGGKNACWPWTGVTDKWGYGKLGLSSAHRLVYAGANKVEIPPRMVIRHTCDNPPCCNPRHLLLGTAADNVADRVARNRSARGTRNGRCKLSTEAVRKIKRSHSTHAELSREHGVHPRTVKDIREGRIWKQI